MTMAAWPRPAARSRFSALESSSDSSAPPSHLLPAILFFFALLLYLLLVTSKHLAGDVRHILSMRKNAAALLMAICFASGCVAGRWCLSRRDCLGVASDDAGTRPSREKKMTTTRRPAPKVLLGCAISVACVNAPVLIRLMSRSEYYTGPVPDWTGDLSALPDECTAKGSHPATARLALRGITPRRRIFLAMLSAVQESGNKHNGTVRFRDVGKSLLVESRKERTGLLTVQVGGMDGTSNDPLWDMFGEEDSLRHWIPVVVEPVPANFVKLREHYLMLQRERNLPCPLLSNRAISDSGGADGQRCEFCYFNTSDNAPLLCQENQDWIRFQLGTLQCDERKKLAGKEVWNKCIVREELECESLSDTLRRWSLSLKDVAMLQMDVEGYESVLLRDIFSGVPVSEYPPVVHFEHKVIKFRDERDKTNNLAPLLTFMKDKGYVLHDQGEDMLALLLPAW